MATPNESSYDRGCASDVTLILFGAFATLLYILRVEGISFLESAFGIEATVPQYLAGAVGILIVLGLLTHFLQDTHRKAQQEAREAGLEEEIFAQAQAGKVDPPFFLFLRPFIPRAQLVYPDDDEGETMQAIVPILLPFGENLEVLLGKAIEPDRFLALGQKGEAIGAARLEVGDSEWQKKLKILAKHAKGILLLPATTDGSLWEIGYLAERQQLLEKTIFLMPPKPPAQSFWPDEKPSLMEEEWAIIADAFNSEGSDFPAYDEKGMLFTIGFNAKIERKASPNWSRPSELGEAIRKLLAPKKVNTPKN